VNEFPQSFPTTHWSLVQRAGKDDGDQSRRALEEFLRRYLPAMRAYLIHAVRVQPDRADDLLQGFVMDRVIQQSILSQADRNRGRFRAFLRRVLTNYMTDVGRYENRLHRAPSQPPVSVDQCHGLAAGEEPSRCFEVAWARQLVTQAVEEMRLLCLTGNSPAVWGVFDGRILGPMLRRDPPTPYADLVRQFQFGSPKDTANALITGKRMFIRVLRSVVGAYAGSPEDIDQEIAELRQILASSGAEMT
jgi:DNA-directed RNA polymerase specialized sigma24 family protein